MKFYLRFCISIVLVVSFTASYAQLSDYKASVLKAYNGSNNINGIGLDAKGNAFIAGYIDGQVIIQKLTPSGQTVWTQNIAGVGVNKIVVDSIGNSYVAGTFYNYLLTLGGIVLTKSAYTSSFNDLFIAKLDSNGNFIWANNGHALAYDLAVDKSGNCFIAGTYSPSGGTLGTNTLLGTSSFNAFLAKLDPSGHVSWVNSETSKIYQGQVNLYGTTVDRAGNVYAAGQFYGNATVGGLAISTIPGIAAEPFVIKYNSNGQFLWLKTVGGLGFASDVISNQSGQIYVTGACYSPTLTVGNFIASSVPFETSFLVQYDENGNENWVQLIEGSGGETSNTGPYPSYAVSGRALSLDSQKNIFLLGWQNSITMTVGSSIIYNATNTGNNLFVTKYNPSGLVINTTNIGSDYPIFSYALDVNPAGEIWLAGQYSGITLNIDPLTIYGSDTYSYDAFVTKLTPYPTINLSTSVVTFGGQNIESFQVSGINLTQDLTLSASNGYSLSLSSGSGFTSSLSLHPTSSVVGVTNIYVSSSSTSNGLVTASSIPATQQKLILSKGSFLTDYLSATIKNMPNVYPNPCSDKFFIAQLSIGTNITILDISGKVNATCIYEGNPISTSGLEKGSYILKAIEDQSIYVFKLIVE